MTARARGKRDDMEEANGRERRWRQEIRGQYVKYGPVRDVNGK